MQKGDDPYEILGVSTDAETSEIRKAYRKLAVVHHPDKQTTEEGREKAHHIFAKIACAYELLSDDQARKDYDEQQQGDEDDDDYHPGFDGNATYDYPFDPNRHAGSQEVAKATEKTGKPFRMFRRRSKKKKPMHFHDPYEVFKRAFKEEFGYEYPGAKFDNVEPDGQKVHQRAKNAPLAIENGSSSGGGKNNKSGPTPSDEEKKKGGILTLFKRKKEDQQLTVYKGDGKNGNGKKGNEVSNYSQPPGNNRPISMETKTHKIEHPDGSVETITETIITRPDGSVEKSRQTDMPEKGTRNWTKPKEDAGAKKKPLKQLTSDKTGQKMLTDGKKKKGAGKKATKKEQPLAITNG